MGAIYLRGRALYNLIFTPGAVQSIDFAGGAPTLSFTLIVQNTNSIGLTLSSMAGNVFTQDGSDKTLVGNVATFQPLEIPGNSQSTIVLQVRLRLLGIVNDIVQAFQTSNFQKTLDFECAANVNGIQMPFNFSLQVGA